MKSKKKLEVGMLSKKEIKALLRDVEVEGNKKIDDQTSKKLKEILKLIDETLRANFVC